MLRRGEEVYFALVRQQKCVKKIEDVSVAEIILCVRDNF